MTKRNTDMGETKNTVNSGCDGCGCFLILLLIFFMAGGHFFVRCGSKSFYIGTEPEPKDAKVKDCNYLVISEKYNENRFDISENFCIFVPYLRTNTKSNERRKKRNDRGY